MKRQPLRLVVWCMVWLAANDAWADEPAAGNEPAEITFQRIGCDRRRV